MIVYVYIPNDFCTNYLPFLLYRDALAETLMTKYMPLFQMLPDIRYLCQLSDIMISCSYLIVTTESISSNIEDFMPILAKFGERCIVANTEHHSHNPKCILETARRHETKLTFFEYSGINYKHIKENCPHIDVVYVPPLYHPIYEMYYNSNIDKRIPWEHKDIDILFYGYINDRRRTILEALSQKFKVYVPKFTISPEGNELLCQLIERSKVIINVYFYDYNKVYDYYRNSLIIANKGLLIAEKHDNQDNEIEYNMIGCDNALILSEYDQIVPTVCKYLCKSGDEIREKVDEQYEWFKKYPMKDFAVPYFDKIQLKSKFRIMI